MYDFRLRCIKLKDTATIYVSKYYKCYTINILHISKYIKYISPYTLRKIGATRSVTF